MTLHTICKMNSFQNKNKMINRGTLGSENRYPVLSYIYDNYENCTPSIQKRILKFGKLVNTSICDLNNVSDKSFRMRVIQLCKKEVIQIAHELFTSDEKEMCNRLLNFTHARFANIMHDTRVSHTIDINRFKAEQRRISLEQNKKENI